MPREVEDWGPSPEEKYEQSELGTILSDTIADLDPSFRIVFQLRDIEELSTEETADVLGPIRTRGKIEAVARAAEIAAEIEQVLPAE